MTVPTIRLFPLAYHVTLQAYGNWLPGDPRGWHNRGDGATTVPRPGNDALRAISRERQRGHAVTLTAPMAAAIVASIEETARAREWRLHIAIAVRSHLHVVVTASATGVGVIDAIRTETTRQLVDGGLHDPTGPLWSSGGHFTRVLDATHLASAIEYVRRHRSPR
jgi:hypothetical protein